MSLTIITCQEFLDRIDTYQKDANITQKYAELFSRYECFSKPNNVYFHKFNKGYDKKPRNVFGIKPKESKKTLQSLWNVLNESNYQKVSHKLKFMVNEDNVTQVVKDIIKNAVLHSTYRKYFLKLLRDLLGFAKEEYIYITISDYFHNYIDGQLFKKENGFNNTENKYDIFCTQQKHKKMTLNINVLLIDIIKEFPEIKINMFPYIDSIIDLIKCDEDFYQDLGLNLMIDICTTPEYVEYISKYDIDWNEIISRGSSSKIKFLVEKIICRFPTL